MSIDFAAVTQRQQKVWASGDYGRIGSLLSWMGETLVHALDIHAGERVLDVAAGNGNASLPAARRFADVPSTDYVPMLLEEAERRAAADGLLLRTQVADAQDLPFGDGEFDVVMSTIGAMFAPDQEAVAREMLRVCRPGGRIGMANWTPDSVVGGMLRTVSRRVPPPQGLQPPVAWGSEERVRQLLGPGCSELTITRRECAFRFPSAEAFVTYFATWYGPTIMAFAAVGESGRDELVDELVALFESSNTADDGTLAMDVAYLEVIGIRA
jgi:SAM-dependent methyltransferase